MHKPRILDDANLPLEQIGCEFKTEKRVFTLMQTLDADLKLSLKANGYIEATDVKLSDGRIINGWIKT